MSVPRKRGPGRDADPIDISDLMLREVPPHNLDAERAVLGGVLLRPALLDDLASQLREEDYYSAPHRAVWRAMLALWQASRPIDLVNVADALQRAGDLEAAGGPAYLAGLTAATISPSAAKSHVAIVRAMAMRRAMIAMGARMLQIAYDPERDPGEFAEVAALASDKVLGDRVEIGGETPAEYLPKYMEDLEKLSDMEIGVDTPFAPVNDYIGGMQPGEMVVLGGRPSDGKTAMALQLATYAQEFGKRVGIFSLEMSRNRLLNRIYSVGADVEARKFRRGHFSDADWTRIYDQTQRLLQLPPLYIYAARAKRVSEIRAACRRWRRTGLDLALIDYAQLLEADGRYYQSREQELAAISGGVKTLAEDIGIPIVLLAQVNRDVIKRKPERILISDLRESGSLEQDADIVLLIQPWRHKCDHKADVHPMTLTVAKARDGETGDVALVFNSKTVHFEMDFAKNP